MNDGHNDSNVDVDDRRPPCHPLDVSMMFLGTASMRPSMSRNVSGNALKIGNEICIVDCGEGTQHQIVKVSHHHNHGHNHTPSHNHEGGGGCGPVERGIRISPGSITRIFITHLHGDHCFGLAGLLCLINNNSHGTTLQEDGGDKDEQGESDISSSSSSSMSPSSSAQPKVVQIVGPKGLRSMLRAALLSSSTNFSFQIRIDELIFQETNLSSPPSTTETTRLRHFATVFEDPPHPSEIPGIDVVSQKDQYDRSIWWTLPCHPDISKNENKDNNAKKGGQVAAAWSMYAAPLVHSIESVGYVFHEHPHQGKLDRTKIQTIKEQLLTEENRRYQEDSCEIKNPLALLGSLQRGNEVTIMNKYNQLQTIHPKDCMSPNTPGRKIVILGDTCDSRQLARLAANADVIVHEATNAAIERDETVEGVLRTAISRGHSTPGMAGTFAKCCRAKQLVLTHFSSRYKGDDSPESLQVMSKIVQEAQKSFANDNVTAARDLMHIPIAINPREQRRKQQ